MSETQTQAPESTPAAAPKAGSVPYAPSVREITEIVTARQAAESRAAELERRLEALTGERDAARTEAEKVKAEREAERAEAEAKKTEQARADAVLKAAKAAGAHNPKDVLALLPADALKVGTDGTVEGLDEAVSALAKERSYLFKPSASGAPGGQPSPAGGAAQSAVHMTQEEYAAARAAITRG